MDSAGVATQAQDTFMTSLAAKTEQFNASVQELYHDFLSSDLAGSVVDFGTGIIQTFDNVLDSIGSVSAAMIALVAGSGLKTLQKAFKNVGDYGGNYGQALMGTSKAINAAVNNFKVSSDLGGTFFQNLTMGAQGFVTSLNPVLIALLGIAAAIGAITAYKNWQENLRKDAEEAATAWGESNDSIEDYKARIEELGTALESGTLTEEEAYEAKSELLSIQQELSESYGEQAEGIDLVNGAWRDQIELLDELAVSNAELFLNDTENQIDKATKKIEDFQQLLTYSPIYNPKEQNAIRDILSDYEDYFRIDETTDNGLTIYFKGNAEDAKDVLTGVKTQINELQDDMGEDFLQDFYNGANDAIGEATDILNKYQEIYDEARAAAIVADTNIYTLPGMREEDGKTAAKWLKDYAEAVDNYNDALLIGDSAKIKEAKKEYEEIDAQMRELEEGDLSPYSYSINEIGDSLNSAAADANEFKRALQGLNTDTSEEKALNKWADELQELDMSETEFLTKLTEEEASGQKTLYSYLADYADAAGLSLEDLTEMLVEIGVLTGDVTNSIKTSKVSLSDMLSSEEEGKFSEQIDAFQSDVDDYNSALDDLRSGEQVNLTDLLQQFPELVDYIENLEGGLENLSFQSAQKFASNWETAFSQLDAESYAAMYQIFNESISSFDLPVLNRYNEAIGGYNDVISEAMALGADTNQTIFGNIDTNNRQVLEWTDENLKLYQDAIESWGLTVDDLKDYSTELGSVWEAGENGEIQIAFSPMLQTENGAVLLDFDTFSDYIDGLLYEVGAYEGKEWSAEELFALDATGLEGFEVDGQQIKGLLAGIGDEAEYASQAMHFTGVDGAISATEKELEDAYHELENFTIGNILSNIDETSAYQSVILRDQIHGMMDSLFEEFSGDEYAIEAIARLSLNPESVNWDMDEWKAQIEDEEIYVKLSVDQTELDKLEIDLTTIQNQADKIQNTFSYKDTFGIKYAAQDYRDLINNGNLQIKNLREQLALQQDILSLTDSSTARYAEVEGEIISIESDILSVVADQREWNEAAKELAYEAGDALNAYNDATSTRNAGDNYLDMMSAFKAANDLFEKGLIGEDDFLKAAAMASPSGIEDVANWAENYSRIMRYMNEEDGTGVLNFLEDLSQKTDAAGESMATYDAETDQWSMNINDLQAVADALNIPLEVTEAIIGRGEDYGLVNNWFATAEDGLAHIGELYSDLADQQYKLDQMRRNGASQEEIDSQEAIIATTKRSIKESQKLERQYKSEATTQGYITQEELANAQELVYKLDQLSEIGSEYESEYLANVIEQLGEEGISEIGGINVSDLFVVDADGMYHLSQEAYNDFKDGLAEEGYELYPESAKVEIARNIGETLSAAYEDSESDVQQTIDKLIEEYDAEDFLGVIFNDQQYTEGLESLEMEMDDLLKEFGLAQDAGKTLGRILAAYKETGSWTEAIEHVVEEIEKEEEIAEELSHPYSNEEIERQANQTQEGESALIQPGEMQTIRLGVEAAAGNEEELELLLNKEPEELEVEYNLSPGSGQSMHDLLQEEYDELQHQQELEENTQEVPIELVIMNPEDFDQLNDLLSDDEAKEISLDVVVGEGGLNADQLQSLTSLLEDNLQEDSGVGIAINFTGDVDADNFETLSSDIESLSSLSGIDNISTDISITADNADADQINSIAESMEKLSDAIGEGNFNATVSISANDISIDDLDSISEDIGRISEIAGAGNVSANIGITTTGTDLDALEKIVAQKDNIKELSEMEDIDFNISIKVNGEEIEDIDEFEEGLDTFTSGYEYTAGNSNLEETEAKIEKVGDEYEVVQGAFRTPLGMSIMGGDDVEGTLESVEAKADEVTNAPKIIGVETIGAEDAEESFTAIAEDTSDPLDVEVDVHDEELDEFEDKLDTIIGEGEYSADVSGLEETDAAVEKVGDDYVVTQGAFTTPLEMALQGDGDVEGALESVENTADEIADAPKVMTIETLGAENAETSFETIGSEFDSLDGRVLTYSFQEDNGDLITLQDLGGGEYAEYTNGEFTATLSLDVEASGMSPEEYFADLYDIDPVTIIVTYETAGENPADGVEDEEFTIYYHEEYQGAEPIETDMQFGTITMPEVEETIPVTGEIDSVNVSADLPPIPVTGIMSNVETTEGGTVNWETGSSPDQVSDASGIANYTVGDYPPTVPDADGIANYTLGTYPTSVPPVTGTANYTLGIYPTSLPPITQTVFQNVVTNKDGDAAGTAHAEGTTSLRNGWKSFKKVGGSYIKGAYAGGSWSDWSLHSDEDALVNELGTESIVIILRLYIVICIENLFNCWEIVKPIKL